MGDWLGTLMNATCQKAHDEELKPFSGPGEDRSAPTTFKNPAGNLRFREDLGLKLDQTKPKMAGTVPTNWHTTIPNDEWPMSACFDDDPKFSNCEIE